MFGAPKKCARCDKQVYSIEELKCLDKVWHKGCFKCTVCSTTLNLKNYKGVNKLPYCAVHYPKQTHTSVNENPELLRIKQNTEIQSNAKYHADYEKSKGNFTVVADDPEMRRVLENTKNISNIKYHEEFEKSRNKYTPVINKIQNENNNNNNTKNTVIAPASNNSTLIASYRSGENQLIQPNIKSQERRIGSIADYDPFSKEASIENSDSSNNDDEFSKQYQAMQQQLTQQKQLLQQQQQKKSQNQTNQIINNNNKVILNQTLNSNSKIEYVKHEAKDSYKNDNYNGYTNGNVNRYDYSFDKTNSFIENGHKNSHNIPSIQTTVFRAIYDYDAKEDDEISFRDGDKFINCEQIDIGWMIGVHEKTGKHGMIPFNYAEPIDLF